MKHLFIILTVLIAIVGCGGNEECSETTQETFYTDGSIKTRTIIDCNNEPILYEHSNFEGENCFKIDYTKINTKTYYLGYPWIHQIWNESTYEIGDTIVFNIDVATPPKFDLVFSINDKVLKNRKSLKQGMDVYEYIKVKESAGEKLNMKAVYSLNGKKWTTFKRSIEP